MSALSSRRIWSGGFASLALLLMAALFSPAPRDASGGDDDDGRQAPRRIHALTLPSAVERRSGSTSDAVRQREHLGITYDQSHASCLHYDISCSGGSNRKTAAFTTSRT